MRRSALLGLLLLANPALANRASIRLESFPSVSVADARSTVTITAEVRDSNGRPVPNGTPVLFTTTLGQFREPLITTENGFARAILKSSAIPGTAKISVSVPAFNTVATMDFEFLSDRSLLSSAKEYIEVVSPGDLAFSLDNSILSASDPNRKVNLRYREIDIQANDLQLEVSSYIVRARKATMKVGKEQVQFEELVFRLNTRRGFGTTVREGQSIREIDMVGFVPVPKVESRERLQVVQIGGGTLFPPTDPYTAAEFEFIDAGDTASRISADKAIVFPRKLVQFQKAQVFVGDQRVMSMPLYQVNLTGGTQIFTEQIVNVNDNQLSVNYPYYLTMKPGETSLLRFRLGGSSGRGFSAAGGAFLDYELKWNRGDEFDGGLTFSGIGRDDWNLGLRQYMKLDDRTSSFLQLDTPNGRYLYGNGNVSRQFDGFSVNFSGNASRALRGLNYEDQRYTISAETDGSKIARMPVTMFYGVNYTSNRSRYDLKNAGSISRSFSDLAFTTRALLSPQQISAGSTLNASVSLNARPQRESRPVGFMASTTLSQQIGGSSSVALTYDYVDDPTDGGYFGRHRLSAQGLASVGRFSLSLFGGQSLDADRFNLFGDASYELSPLWRLMGTYTYDRYIGETVLDYGFGVAYRIGWREIGLTWSRRTKRLGIQILGASFN